jgi:HlyD family secretion protein/macrolide-specific efflux system membrane fusion protein
MSSKWLKIGAIVAGLAVLGGAGYYYAKDDSKSTAVTQTVQVARGKVTSQISATGAIKPLNSVEISSKVTARLKSVLFKENDTVNAGDVVAYLDSTQLETKLEQAKFKVTNTKAKYERLQYLNSIGAKSDQDLEDALLDYQNATSDYESAQSDVEDTVIVSSISGIVIGEPKTVGSMITAGVNEPTVIMTVADLSQKQISAKIDETDIGKIIVGQKAEFTVDTYTDKTFTAKVSKISQTDISNSWSDTNSTTSVIYYTVTLDIDDPEGLLKPGMTARVNVITAEKDDVLLIPISALKTNNDGQYVVVVQPDGKTRQQMVTTGLYSDDNVEIVDGLSEGDVLSVSYTKTTTTSSSSKSQGGPPPM